MAIHKVKSWTHLFDELEKGKHHDLRIMDRDYKVGDYLILQRYDYGAGKYTGQELIRQISYITSAQHQACAFSPTALHPDYAILSLEPVKPC